jgi:hypothetical protein
MTEDYLTKAHRCDADAKDYRELADYMEAKERGEEVDWLPMTPRGFRGPVSRHSTDWYRKRADMAAEKAEAARTMAVMMRAIEVDQRGPRRLSLAVLHARLDGALKEARDILTVATDEEQPVYAALPQVMRLIEEAMRLLDMDDEGDSAT